MSHNKIELNPSRVPNEVAEALKPQFIPINAKGCTPGIFFRFTSYALKCLFYYLFQ